MGPGPKVLRLSAIDDTANAKLRADALKHFLDVHRRLHTLKKLHPLVVWEGEDDSNLPAHFIEWRELRRELERCAGTLRQFGISRHDLERESTVIEEQGDASKLREQLLQADTPPSATAQIPREHQEMELLLRKPVPSGLDRFFGLLTENEQHLATLRWGYNWSVAKIARARGRSRKTIDEALANAKRKMGSQSNASKSEGPHSWDGDIVATIDEERAKSRKPRK